MATQRCPYRVGQKVQLISAKRGREHAHVLSIHRPTTGGFEIVVRTLDRVDAPGRNVNVFMTSGRSAWLAAQVAAGSGVVS